MDECDEYQGSQWAKQHEGGIPIGGKAEAFLRGALELSGENGVGVSKELDGQGVFQQSL